MRIGILGGSFNPPHLGHLAMARAARAALRLDRVLLVPAHRPPHKPGHPELAAPAARLELTRRLAAEDEALEVSDIELRRPGPSYTIDTITELQRERPQDELFFLIGGDTVGELPTWKRAGELLRQVPFVVVNRPGSSLEEGLAALGRGLGDEVARDLRERIVTMDPVPISSSEIRRRVREGAPWADLVPAAVADYVQSQGLYGRNPVAEQATVATLSRHVGEEVELRGWIYKLRGKGKIAFLHLRDGTGVVQAVLKRDDVGEEALKALKEAGQESSLIVRGVVSEDARAPGGYELQGRAVELVHASVGEYPIALQSDQGVDFLLSHRHLWLRSSKQHAVMRVRNEVIKTITDFFYERDFVRIDAPVFTPAACEGTTTLFEVDYFDDKAYLTQSGQLYMEAGAMAHGKCYCFGPTFRAERSKTRRHLTEFWMVEPEMAFAGLEQVMDLAEEFLETIVQRVLERCKAELETLERDTSALERVKRPFPRISYDAAVKLLQDKGVEFEWGGDFGAPDETAISENFDRPVMVYGWPRAIKAFYMARDPNDERLCLGVDVIAPEGVGEVIGGGERSADLAYLEEKIAEHKLPKEAFEWYLDLRRYGSVQHGGFGLGLERTVAWLCGREHIREAIPFPRTIYRKEP